MDNYYNQIAEGYDELYQKEQLQKLNEISKLLKKHKIKIKEDFSLLDVGCGTGISTEYFKCNTKGIDPSEKLIQIAKDKRRVDCYVAPAENIPFQANEFDFVVSLTAIQNFDDINKGLDEIKRVGKNYFILTFLKKSEKANIIQKLIEEKFKIIEKIESEKDFIYILNI